MTYYEPAREIPLYDDYDLIVVGSGPAGIAAAVSAGRRGIKALLIESQGTVGGTATAGSMSHFTGTCDSALYREILDRMNKEKLFPDGHSIYIEPETLKSIYFKMLDEAGCQKHFPQTEGYTIPYGCLIPKEKDGLLLSGRNISGTHMAHSNYRVMPICIGIGEACGVAASIAITEDISLRDVPPKCIRRALGRE